MKAIRADFMLDKNGDIQKNRTLIYDKKIINVLESDKAIEKYPQLKPVYQKNTLLMPTFCNPHVHLEFSQNRCGLNYGEFTRWLGSVIANPLQSTPRELRTAIDQTIAMMLQSGTTAVGAISSFGGEIDALTASKLKAVIFNEVIGADPMKSDEAFTGMLARYERTLQHKSERFIPALSAHSPYSTHPELIKKIVAFAKQNDLLITTHFLESQGEKEWMESSTGKLRAFFSDFFKLERESFATPKEFLELFEGSKTLFVHANFAESKELELIKKMEARIITCPRSNRLLNNCRLDWERAMDTGLFPLVATDGMSSNTSLSMLDELKTLLFIYYDKEIETYAKNALLSATRLNHEALGIDSGTLEAGKNGDFMLMDIPQDFAASSNQHSGIIFHAKPTQVFINGEPYGNA